MNKGNRVELHPGLDAWMQGDRYGTIVRKLQQRDWEDEPRYTVKMDKSGRTLKVPESRLTRID